MSPLPALAGPARRYLADRLGRLHDALAGLTRRLHESIASVVGSHVGDAVREAVEAALERGRATPRPAPYPAGDPYARPYADRYPEETPGLDDPGPFWHDARPPEAPPAPPAPDPPPAPGSSPRWRTLLPAALQAAAWWMSRPRGPA